MYLILSSEVLEVGHILIVWEWSVYNNWIICFIEFDPQVLSCVSCHNQILPYLDCPHTFLESGTTDILKGVFTVHWLHERSRKSTLTCMDCTQLLTASTVHSTTCCIHHSFQGENYWSLQHFVPCSWLDTTLLLGYSHTLSRIQEWISRQELIIPCNNNITRYANIIRIVWIDCYTFNADAIIVLRRSTVVSDFSDQKDFKYCCCWILDQVSLFDFKFAIIV